jgi:putative alpha-1,2-mannosidase
MMGFYPVTSGVPVYVLGSPVFDRVDVKLPGGKTFTLAAKNNSRDNKYVQSVKLNDQARSKVWFTHAELTQGGRLDLEMSAEPNHVLGTRSPDLPPSRIFLDPASLQ